MLPMRNAVRRLARTLIATPIAAAALVAACGDHSNPTALDPTRHSSQVVRDARNGGAAGFFFLTPIAAATTYPGTFDPNRSPSIEVCAWTGTTCTGPFTTFSRGAGTIAVDAANQLYRADWSTVGLPAGQRYRIRVVEGTTELGVADAQIPAANETPAQLVAEGIVPLGNATRLPIRFRLEVPAGQNRAPVVNVTSPASGTVVSTGATVTLTADATDPESGNLASEIVWRSSQVASPLGTGPSITVTLASGRHTISASVTDPLGLTGTATISVIVSIVSLPSTLNIPYGGTASLPITLSEAAPAGGLTFTVTSAEPGRVGVTTSTVTVPAGQLTATATLSGASPGVSNVTVSHPDYGSATTVATTTASLNIVQPSVSFTQGSTAQITIELQSAGIAVAAPPGGIQATLSSSALACVGVTSPVTIAAGATSATATLSHGGVGVLPCTATVTASVTGEPAIASDAATVTVTAAPTGTLTFNLAGLRLGSGLRALSTIALGTPAPAGGSTITVTSADPARLLVSASEDAVGQPTAALSVPAGNTSVTFYLHGVENQAGTASLTAEASGYAAASGAVPVVATAFAITGLDPTTAALAADDPFQIVVGAANAAGNGLAEQVVRPGSPGLTFSVTSSTPSVGTLVTSAGTGPSRSVTVPAQQSRTATTVAAGGIAFRPQAGGTTTVSATGSGTTLLALPDASELITVSGSAIVVNTGSARLGSGLRYSPSVQLGVAAPAGGIAVTLTSSNPSLLLLSPQDNSVGQPSITITVSAGNSTAGFYAHGLEGQTGAATITATATGFASGSGTVNVVPTASEIILLDAEPPAAAEVDPFQIRVGAVNAAGNDLFEEQVVRPGSGGLTFTVTSSNAAVGLLVTSAGAAQSRTVVLSAGSSRTPGSVATGGIAFDPLGIGATVVAVSGAGAVFAAVPGSSQTITVTSSPLTVNPAGLRVGNGLRESASVSFGAPVVAGTSVTLTSSDPTRLLVSAQNNSVGQPSVTIPVPAGNASVGFYVHGVEGQTGDVTVTATSAGYGQGSRTVPVVPVAYEILLLDVTTTSLAEDDPFLVRVGAINPAGNDLYAEQVVRPGATLTFTVTSSNAAVARLVTSAGAAASRTVLVSGGASRSPGSVAAGGVALDALSPGTTTIAAGGAGALFAPLAEASQTVTVIAPALTVNTASVRVGSGLRERISVGLGAPALAGTTVTLTSSNPSVLLVSPLNNSVGTASATVTVPTGNLDADFYVHGIEGQTGTVTLTATSTGFASGTGPLAVVPIAFDLVSLGATYAAGDANDLFQVRVGAVNATTNGFYNEQVVRPGSAGLVFSVTSSNAAVARLVTSAVTGQTVSTTIAALQSRTGTSLANAGVLFDPVGPGTTSVAASTSSTPNVPLANATQQVTVTGAAATLGATRLPSGIR